MRVEWEGSRGDIPAVHGQANGFPLAILLLVFRLGGCVVLLAFVAKVVDEEANLLGLRLGHFGVCAKVGLKACAMSESNPISMGCERTMLTTTLSTLPMVICITHTYVLTCARYFCQCTSVRRTLFCVIAYVHVVAPVAQRIERTTFNRVVVGSIPTWCLSLLSSPCPCGVFHVSHSHEKDFM